MGVADIIRLKNTVANLNHQSIINMKAIDWNHESSSDHIECIHLTLGMNGDITPSSYTDWSTKGWWRLRRTSSMKMAAMELGNTPRPLPHHLTRIEAHRGDGDSRERRRWRWRWWSLGTPLGQHLGVLLLTSFHRRWSLRRAHLTLSLILRRRFSGEWRR
jgi:hypothetical protein